MHRGARALLATAVAAGVVLPATTGGAAGPVSTQVLRGVTVPAGFGASVFAATPGGLPTSIAFGPDGRLYTTVVDPSFTSGSVQAVQDLGGVGARPQTAATGFTTPLGVAFAPDGTMFVSDTNDNRGRVVARTDKDKDGVYETERVLLKNIPNGQHQTNNMRVGPDGLLYVANGSATDDGLECGPEPANPLVCPAPEVLPWSGSILKVDPSWNGVDLLRDVDVTGPKQEGRLHADDVLAARGLRNSYDLDFWPGDRSQMYTWMNGSDDPASSEPLYRTDVSDGVVADMGFPSCLYDPHPNPFPEPVLGHDHPGNPEPENNSDQRVLDAFGACRKGAITRPIAFTTEGHEGTTGMVFERNSRFPARFDGDLFVAQYGGWWNVNGGQITGRKILHVDIDGVGEVTDSREFMTSPMPMDVEFGPDGALYVADLTGVVYRVVHVADAPDSVTVRIVQGQFVPQLVTVPRRTTVTWVNDDTASHDVRATQSVATDTPVLRPGKEIDSPGRIPPGGTHSYRFGDEESAYAYQSSTSPAARGSIVVAPVDR
jgi:glucose/arabinose dehydrogenase